MSTRAPRLNVDLLDRTMAEVQRAARRKTRRWDQSYWRKVTPCGTSMCFAGWALEFDGGVEWDDSVGMSDTKGTRLVGTVRVGTARRDVHRRRRQAS